MKSFEVPEFYRSPIISKVKQYRKLQDPRKKDNTPTLLDFGPIQFYIARYFGFCYGVENAIEISFKAVAENPDKRIFLLSQMIHNPLVNQDLLERGVQFLQDTNGTQLISFDTLTPEDVVIIPAFGAPLKTEAILKEKGVNIANYNTTCPFVERVWKKSEQIGKAQYTIIIHGKSTHEETKATFSRSDKDSKAIVIKDMEEAETLALFIAKKKSQAEFEQVFKGKISEHFNIETDLNRIGVINQTTMLATETQAIADYLKQVMIGLHGEANLKDHFADTRDTLCYATNENQDATYGLLETDADIAIVVGGYNSSNTSHLVELLERKFPTFFISGPEEIISELEIHHFDYHHQQHITTFNFLPEKENIKIIVTSGASCPDSLLDEVMKKLLSYNKNTKTVEEVLEKLVMV
jgi:4-hydroxy-3-methylbut-2-en-1-yl diphosphate reductase